MSVCIKLGIAALVLVLSLRSHAQGTFQWTVTYDGGPHIAPSDTLAISYYYEQGMEFRPTVSTK